MVRSFEVNTALNTTNFENGRQHRRPRYQGSPGDGTVARLPNGEIRNPPRESGDLRKIDRAAQCLFDQIESVDQHPHAEQAPALELCELRDAQADGAI